MNICEAANDCLVSEKQGVFVWTAPEQKWWTRRLEAAGPTRTCSSTWSNLSSTLTGQAWSVHRSRPAWVNKPDYSLESIILDFFEILEKYQFIAKSIKIFRLIFGLKSTNLESSTQKFVDYGKKLLKLDFFKKKRLFYWFLRKKSIFR